MRVKRSTMLAAFALFASPSFAAITVTDDSGAAVTLAKPAARVVGAVSYSDYPKEAQAIARVGDNKTLDLERIAALHPDLIVVWRHGNAGQQLDRLRALGIPVYASEPKHLGDITTNPTNLDRLGALLGTETQARAASSAFLGDIAALRATYAHRPPVGVFYQVWDDPLMTINGDNVFSEVISLCGGVNVFAAEKLRVPTLSTESASTATGSTGRRRASRGAPPNCARTWKRRARAARKRARRSSA